MLIADKGFRGLVIRNTARHFEFREDGDACHLWTESGATIKELGSSARAEMEQLFGHRVHLFLHVKVRENWADDPAHYREMGLEVPKRGLVVVLNSL